MGTAKKHCTDGIARFSKNLGLATGLSVEKCETVFKDLIENLPL